MNNREDSRLIFQFYFVKQDLFQQGFYGDKSFGKGLNLADLEIIALDIP